MSFQVGYRVRIIPERAANFTQPWRGRFEKGREGTVINIGPETWRASVCVRWDSTRAKRPHEWLLRHYPGDLQVVEAAQ